MLDLRRIRENPEEVQAALSKRGKGITIAPILELDKKRREILGVNEEKKARRNKISKEIPQRKKAGEDVAPITAEMKTLSDQIKEEERELAAVDEELRNLLLHTPNTPDASVPEGGDDADNVEIRKWGEPRAFDFEPKAHWDLCRDLDILSAETGSKVAGSRFMFYKGAGARLERSIIDFMLDTHTLKNGYTEVIPPFVANRAAMEGTGQLPKFAEDMYHLEDTDLYLIPTAEVPVTNMYRDQILPGEALPLYRCAYTPCFRKEAGSAGRDVKGVIRVHQFNKVELVKFVHPDTSFDELDKLVANAAGILEALKLPYRVVALCGGDLGFSSAKTFDLEVWLPSYNRYVEISSCSNFCDYQARRAAIRYRDADGKARLVHTLNGSGLAAGRTFGAVIENYQNEDGSVTIPEVLRPYMGMDVIPAKD